MATKDAILLQIPSIRGQFTWNNRHTRDLFIQIKLIRAFTNQIMMRSIVTIVLVQGTLCTAQSKLVIKLNCWNMIQAKVQECLEMARDTVLHL